MSTTPELEACGWFVRTKRTAEDSAGWIVADCSAHRHGAEYARLFAAAPKLLAVAQMINAHGVASPMVMKMAAEAIAAATGKGD